MTIEVLTVEDVDYSGIVVAELPGADLHEAYASYFFGSAYESPNGYRTDYSGGNRTLADVGTPAVYATRMEGGHDNHLSTPFSLNGLWSNQAITVVTLMRPGSLSGQQQIFGNIASSGHYVSLQRNQGNLRAIISGTQGAKTATRAIDTATQCEWHILAARWSPNTCDVIVRRADLVLTVVSATAFTGQSVTDSSVMRWGGSELTNQGANPDIAAGALFRSLLTGEQIGEVGDMQIEIASLFGLFGVNGA